jgi:hypothetical protein
LLLSARSPQGWFGCIASPRSILIVIQFWCGGISTESFRTMLIYFGFAQRATLKLGCGRGSRTDLSTWPRTCREVLVLYLDRPHVSFELGSVLVGRFGYSDLKEGVFSGAAGLWVLNRF